MVALYLLPCITKYLTIKMLGDQNAALVVNSRRIDMARKATRHPTNGRLEEALATLLQNQAALASNQIAFVGQQARMEENYARIREELGQIKEILIHHQQTLDALPETIREKIGFRKPR